MKKIIVIVFLLLTCNINAQLVLPKIFNDNMVLQRNTNCKIWGTAKAFADITIQINNNTVFTKTDNTGHWNTSLIPMLAGGPYELIIQEKINSILTSRVFFKNILVGDVWLASGQSNMEWKVNQSDNSVTEIAIANYPNIRFFQVPHAMENKPQTTIKSGDWKQCDSTTVGEQSAVAYFFAKKIHTDIHVPIGIIQSTWGGTPIETWTSKEMLMTVPEINKQIIANENISQKDFDNASAKGELFWKILMESKNGLAQGFATTDFNDAAWKKVQMPNVLKDIDTSTNEHIVWLRKKITIPETMMNKDLQINLGRPDILYSLYFNNQMICENKWNAELSHTYSISKNLTKAGENSICIRLAVMWGSGGLIAPTDSLYITDGKTKISIAGEWKYNKDAEQPFPYVESYQKFPTFLFNGMINPIIPFGIKGFLWYQGEENAEVTNRAMLYRTLFPLMVSDWRQRWKLGNIPFLFVQLANFKERKTEPSESNWAILRESQTMLLKDTSTGMAVTIDIGNGKDIHPKNKQDVGDRLARAAEHIAYNNPIEYSGPMYESMTINKNEIKIHFKHAGSGLITRDNTSPKGFAVAGVDKKFYWADAVIDGEYIIVKSNQVPAPIAVRYAWADNPACNVYNKDNLPAIPFRTDAW